MVRSVSFVGMGKREMRRLVLVGATGAIVATYASRGIDWLITQLPALGAVLSTIIEWSTVRSWNLLHQSPLEVGSIAALFLLMAIGPRLGSAVRPLSRRVIARAARRLPKKLRDRWREEWLGELRAISDARPISGLVYAVSVAQSSGRVASFR